MSILVTGYKGLLGSAIMRYASMNNISCIPFLGDITKGEDFMNIDSGSGINFIIHTAACTDVAYCEKNPDFCSNVNILGTKHVVDYAKKISATLLFISTVSVFSGETGNYKEHDTPHPVGVYNISKHEAEKIVYGYKDGYIARINIVGIHHNGSRGKNFLEWVYDCAKKDKDMQLFDDVWINPLSDFTLAKVILEIVKKVQNGLLPERFLHLGSSDHITKAAIARKVIQLFPNYSGKTTSVSVDTLPGPKRPKQMWLNTETTEKVLKMKMPTVEMEIEKIFKQLV